jgi:hypothetical protein
MGNTVFSRGVAVHTLNWWVIWQILLGMGSSGEDFLEETLEPRPDGKKEGQGYFPKQEQQVQRPGTTWCVGLRYGRKGQMCGWVGKVRQVPGHMGPIFLILSGIKW